MKIVSLSPQRLHATIYRDIAKEYFQPFMSENEKFELEAPQNNTKIDEKNRIIEGLSTEIEAQLNPTKNKKMRNIFSLLNTYELNKDEKSSPKVLDAISRKSLCLISGDPATPYLNLSAHIDRTVTGVGQAVFLKRLALPKNPFTDLPDLLEQQAIIRHLVADEELFEKLDAILHEIKRAENSLISFWRDPLFAYGAKKAQVSHLKNKANVQEASDLKSFAFSPGI